MRYAGGVDVGSTQTKAVVIDEARRIVGRALIMTGANVVTAAQEAFQAALDDGVVREADVDFAVKLIRERIGKLREMSPLWEMYKEGIDLNSVQWAAH